MQHRARPGGDWRKLLPPQRPVQAAAAAQRRRQQQWLRLLWLRQQQWLRGSGRRSSGADAGSSSGVSGWQLWRQWQEQHWWLRRQQ